MFCNTPVLTKGQVITKYYRWMNKNGGWVWMQTKASLIPHPDNPEIKQMLCLNYIVRYVEHTYLVLLQIYLYNLIKVRLVNSGILTLKKYKHEKHTLGCLCFLNVYLAKILFSNLLQFVASYWINSHQIFLMAFYFAASTALQYQILSHGLQ